MPPTLAQQFPDLYASGKTPALKEFVQRVFSDVGLAGNSDVVSLLVDLIRQYIMEGGS